METERTFSLDTPETGPYADAAALLRLLLRRGQALEAIGMVRWDRLPDFLGARWPAFALRLEEGLRAGIIDALSPADTCIRFDEFGFLVVLGEAEDWGSVASRFLEPLAGHLLGAIPSEGLLEAWRAVSWADGVLSFRPLPVAGETPETPPPPSQKPASPAVLADAGFRYLPIWDVRGNAVFSYLCQPVWSDSTGRELQEADLAARFAKPRASLALDIEVLEKAVETLNETLDRDLMASLLVPVHFSTLASDDTARRYIDALRSAYSLVNRYLYLEIYRLSEAESAGRLENLVGKVRPFCAGVLVRLGKADERLLAEARDAHVRAVGLDVRGDMRPEVERTADLEAFVGCAGEQSLPAYVLGLESTSLSVAAVCAGFDLVGSDAIGAALEGWAMDDHLVKPIDLYRTLLRGGG